MSADAHRYWWHCLTLVVAITPVLDASPSEISMAELRKAAAERPRRIIFNNDGNEPLRLMREATAEALLEPRTAALAGSHVDSIFYCTLSAGFGQFTHLTKVGQVFTSRDGPFANSQVERLVANEIDPLQVMIDFAKAHDIEIFWSMRMNDNHDGGARDQGPILFHNNRIKTENPDFLLGRYRERLKHGSWSAVDYAHPEVRELAFRFVEEVCRNYDIDGVELDFFRHPVYFTSTTRGQHASDEEREVMTQLMRRIRVMADNVGRERGRPILIAMRLPDSAEYCRAIGLDLDRWLAEPLLDLLVVTSYFRLNDWDYSVALARKFGVKIYASLDESRLTDEQALRLRRTDRCYRGRAAQAWAAGVDGIYMFNFFDPHSRLWHELGDPQILARLEKDYFATVRGAARAAGGNLPIEPFQHVETLNPGSPRVVAPGERQSARLHIGPYSPAASPKLRLRFASPPTGQFLKVSLNGQILTEGQRDGGWLELMPDPASLRAGANEASIWLHPAADEPLRWIDLYLIIE